MYVTVFKLCVSGKAIGEDQMNSSTAVMRIDVRTVCICTVAISEPCCLLQASRWTATHLHIYSTVKNTLDINLKHFCMYAITNWHVLGFKWGLNVKNTDQAHWICEGKSQSHEKQMWFKYKEQLVIIPYKLTEKYKPTQTDTPLSMHSFTYRFKRH